MNLEYSLDKEDYLQHQLFEASRSKRVRYRRLRSWLIVPVLYLVSGFLFYILKDIVFLITFACISAVWLIFYPLFSRWQYKRHFSKYLDEHYKHRFNRSRQMSLAGGDLLVNDEVSEGKMQLSEIDFIYNLENYVYLHMKSGTTIILPKAKLDDNDLTQFVSRIEDQIGIKRESLDWKWK